MSLTHTTASNIESIIKPRYQRIRAHQTEKEDLQIETQKKIIRIDNTIKSEILDIAAIYEEYYIQNGFENMIGDISSLIIRDLKKYALDSIVDHLIKHEILPEKYKHSNKSKSVKSDIILDNLKHEVESNIEKFDNLEKDQIKQAHELKLKELKKLEQLADTNEVSLLPDDRSDESGHHSALGELDQQEKEKYGEKISASPPLPTIDVTEEDIKHLAEKFDEVVDTWHDCKEYFTKKYPPRTQKTLNKVTKCLDIYIQEIRPYVDEKFRRDWPMWAKIVDARQQVSSTNASKISAITAAYVRDPKTGELAKRTITKEQIDSVYQRVFNFLVDSMTNNREYLAGMSEAYAENGAPCHEDRALKLHDKFSHLS